MPPTQPLTPRSAAVATRLAGPSASPSGPVASKALIPLGPGQVSLRNQQILTEHEYTSSLSSIIKRDFFPHLDRLRAENDYLGALEDGDDLRISIALKKLVRLDEKERGIEGGNTPRHGTASTSATPRGSSTARSYHPDQAETPLHGSRGARGWEDTPAARSVLGDQTPYSRYEATASQATRPADEDRKQGDDEEEESSGIVPDLTLSLDTFQSSYTSEDNASFSQIMDRANQLRKERFAWAYTAERQANEKKRKALEGAQREAVEGKKLAIAAADEAGQRIEAKERLLIEQAPVETKDASTTTPTASTASADQVKDPLDDLILVPEARKDDRKNSTTTWRFRTKNALMYAPDENLSTSRSRNSSLVRTGGEERATRSLFRDGLGAATTSGPSISYRSTDFPTYDEDSREDGISAAPGTPTSSKIDAAIRGSIAASSVTGDHAADAGSGTPRVAGYGFVSPYQTPAPGSPSDPRAASTSTPTPRLRGLGAHPDANSSGHTFTLPPTRRREELASRLSRSATKSLRTKAASSSSSTSSRAEADDATPYGATRYQGLALRSGGGGFGLASSPAPTPSSRNRKSRDQLTPAARSLLDKTTVAYRGNLSSTPRGSAAQSLGQQLLGKRTAVQQAGREGKRREPDEVISMERLKRQRWEPTPSPVPSRSGDR